jgi:hypothetical protein
MILQGLLSLTPLVFMREENGPPSYVTVLGYSLAGITEPRAQRSLKDQVSNFILKISELRLRSQIWLVLLSLQHQTAS